MKSGDKYLHYKGNEYQFQCIALPLKGELISKKDWLVRCGVARYHENDADLDLYMSNDGVTFIDSELPHVIYQAEKDYGTKKVWAREVDDFFGIAVVQGLIVKRFSLLD